MYIQARTVTGNTISVLVSQEDTIERLKEKIEAENQLPKHQQRLLCAGRRLNDEQTLRECGIGEGDTLHLLLAMEGGGRQKKSKIKRKKRNGLLPAAARKKRGKKKKTHHLAVLNHYEVNDETGAIRKLRLDCPSADCSGEGVHLAVHSDRMTCGKCGLTYHFDFNVNADAM